MTPGAVACQAPLSMGFPRQEDWSGLPLHSPGDLPDPGIECKSSALAGSFFTTELLGKLIILTCTFLWIIEKREKKTIIPKSQFLSVSAGIPMLTLMELSKHLINSFF